MTSQISRLDEGEIDRVFHDAVSTFVRGEDDEWFVDSDASLSSSDSDEDKMYSLVCKGESET